MVRSSWIAEYYNRPDATGKSLRDGFFSVGDVAYRDDEGYYYICDRKNDMIISGGVNIYPAEIEAVLHAHPAVADAAVIGGPALRPVAVFHCRTVPLLTVAKTFPSGRRAMRPAEPGTTLRPRAAAASTFAAATSALTAAAAREPAAAGALSVLVPEALLEHAESRMEAAIAGVASRSSLVDMSSPW